MTAPVIKVYALECDPPTVSRLRRALATDPLGTYILIPLEKIDAGLPQRETAGNEIFLLDLSLPGGPAALAQVRQWLPGAPLVVCVRPADEQAALQAMQTGAQDYFLKTPAGFTMAGRILRYALERQQLRREVWESEQRFADVFHASPAAQLLTSQRDGRILDANAAFCRLSGYERAALLGHTIAELNFWVNPRARRKTFLRLQLDGHARDVETECRTCSGEIRTLLISLERLTYKGEKCIISTAVDITGRKCAEEALRESEARFSAIFHTSPIRISITRLTDGLFLDVNDGFLASTGYTRTEIVGHNSSELRDWVESGDRLRLHNLLLEQKQVLNFETRFRQKGGQIRDVLISAVLIDLFGERCILSVALDITERKQAELALRASEEKYRGLMESLDNVVATVDAEGRFLYMNEIAAHQLGGAPQDFVGKTMGELFPEPVAATQLQHIQQAIRTNERFVSENQTIVQGTPRWHRTLIEPIHDETGRVSHALVNSIDIHDLKTTQQELQELNRTLEERVQQRTAEVQDLYDNAPTGYHSLDIDGRFVIINQTELTWLGYTSSEMLGRPISDFLTPASQALFQENFLRFKQSGSVKDVEYTFIRRDGTMFPALVNGVALYDEQGNFVMCRSTLLDITERKAAEEALHRANLELERALRMKDEFLANMSHELRTPLNGILGISEILLGGYRGELNEYQQKLVRTIDVSGHHLLDLINDLLDVSKIEAGRLEIHPEALIVAELCQACLAFVKEQAAKKNISLELQMETSPAIIAADQRRLKQILVNLLSNAVKFTPAEGHVTLKVAANPPQSRLEFSVSDTGIGIAPADLQRLFTPFIQVDTSLTRHHEGTGLGLALVKRLTELHGGQVSATSELGQGSCFVVALPWNSIPETPPAAQPALAEAQPQAAVRPSLRPMTIVVAEDNETNLVTLRDFLESLGHRVNVAQNGLEAIHLTEIVAPDLILMDIQMPTMDGLEAIRHLRANPRFSGTPIIAVTALAMPGDRERCLAAGANEYLSKPVSLQELSVLFNRLLAKT